VIEASHNMKKINRKWEQERNKNYKNNKQNKIKINDLVKVRILEDLNSTHIM